MIKTGNRKLNNKGFTLVELIVVLAILSIIVGIATVKYSESVKFAKFKKVLGDCKAIGTATTLYYLDTGEWPRFQDTGKTNMQAYLHRPNGVAGWNGPYLDKWPANPLNNGSLESQKSYQLDYRKINNKNCLVVETSLVDVKDWDKLANYIDNDIDKGDGKNSGKIQWTNQYICWIIEVEPKDVKYTNGNLVNAH